MIFKGKDETMAMSKDRVRFHIGDRYFRTLGDKSWMGKVMARAFGISALASKSWLRGDGVWITCRPSQFARFLIYRNEANITNGFMDLHAELVQETPNAYDMLAEIAGITHDQAKRVSLALHYGGPQDIMDRIRPEPVGELDVSANS